MRPADTVTGPEFGRRYGGAYQFYTERGTQVGPEQANVAPAVTYALRHGWKQR